MCDSSDDGAKCDCAQVSYTSQEEAGWDLVMVYVCASLLVFGRWRYVVSGSSIRN